MLRIFESRDPAGFRIYKPEPLWLNPETLNPNIFRFYAASKRYRHGFVVSH